LINNKITDLSHETLDMSVASFCLIPSGLFSFRSPVQLPSRSRFAIGLKHFLQSWGPWYNPPVESRTDEDFVPCWEPTSSMEVIDDLSAFSQTSGNWSLLPASWAWQVSTRFSWLSAIYHLQTFCHQMIGWSNTVSILLRQRLANHFPQIPTFNKHYELLTKG